MELVSLTNVFEKTRNAPRSHLQSETISPGALSALKRLFDAEREPA